MHLLRSAALLVAATALTAPAFADEQTKSVPIPTLVRQCLHPALELQARERADGDRPRGSQGAGRRGQHLVQCRVEGRAQGQDRLRAPVRASDVQRQRRTCRATIFTYLQQIGATDYNGTTWFDRTNYFETVPAGALERALFMESDRMGHLLGAVTQGVLDNQRGVVQNEKRQGDSRPGGLVEYEMFGNLFPDGHPYHHATIGSMADLDAASLADVKQWFRDKYGPNNAVLVIAGDVTAAAGAAAGREVFRRRSRAGPVNRPAMATVPTLAKAKSIAMKDRVATTVRSSATGRCRVCSTSGSLRSTSAARCSAGSPARASTRSWSAKRRSRSRSAPA